MKKKKEICANIGIVTFEKPITAQTLSDLFKV